MLMRRGAQGRRAAVLLKKTLARPANASLRPSRPARLTQAAMSRIRRAVETKAGLGQAPEISRFAPDDHTPTVGLLHRPRARSGLLSFSYASLDVQPQ